MPVYKKREIEGKDMRVTVRLSADEVSTFDRMVKQVGAGSRSELMRLMMHNYVHNGTEAPTPAPTPTVQMNINELHNLKTALDDWCVKHKQAMDQLKGVANNINQVTMDVHTGARDSAQMYQYLERLTILLTSYTEVYDKLFEIVEVVNRECGEHPTNV